MTSTRTKPGREKLDQLADCAREFCDHIDSLEYAGRDWLQKLSGLLARVHVAVVEVEADSDGPLPSSGSDYDSRFELYSQLRRKLGDQDHYWMAFDTEAGVDELSGSLADDITDIYFELQQGLKLLETDPTHPRRAANQWRTGYQRHWGQHLVDAERHLYELQASKPTRYS